MQRNDSCRRRLGGSETVTGLALQEDLEAAAGGGAFGVSERIGWLEAIRARITFRRGYLNAQAQIVTKVAALQPLKTPLRSTP